MLKVPSERPKTERTRTPQACHNCRRRKSKCNGIRPCCQNCGRRKEKCEWPDNPVPGSYTILDNDSPESGVNLDIRWILRDPDATSPLTSSSEALPPALLRLLLQTFYRYHHDVEFCSFIHKQSFDIEKCTSPFFVTSLIVLSSLYHSSEETMREFGVDIALRSQNYFLPKARAYSRDQSHTTSVYNIQANLLLALYELLIWNENGAWICTGFAIRMATALRLGKEYNQYHLPKDKEIRRRTFWATYTMDRLVALCSARLPTIKPYNVAIQLPCPEADFAYEYDFRGPNIEQILSGTDLTPQSGPLSFYTATMTLWGGMTACYTSDGRGRANLQPSNPASRFYKAEKALENWVIRLPVKMQWSETNYDLHKSLGHGKVFVTMHLMIRHGFCYAHQEYLPQLDEPASFLDWFDGAGLSYHHHDPHLIGICESSATEIVNIASFLFNGGKDDREALQSVAAASALLTAGAVKLWSQHVGSLQDETGEATLFAQAQFETVLDVFRSWNNWKVVTTWIETLEMLAQLYTAAYTGQPDPSPMFDQPEPPESELIEKHSSQIGITDNGNGLRISNGSGIPDPTAVRQRLPDKIRAIMLLNFIPSSEKEKAMRIYLGTLWQHMSLPGILEQYGSVQEM